jgi:hypothetical protein
VAAAEPEVVVTADSAGVVAAVEPGVVVVVAADSGVVAAAEHRVGVVVVLNSLSSALLAAWAGRFGLAVTPVRVVVDAFVAGGGVVVVVAAAKLAVLPVMDCEIHQRMNRT